MTTHCLALLLPWSQESESGLSRLKGNYSCFSVVCALTFHSHGNDKFSLGWTFGHPKPFRALASRSPLPRHTSDVGV